MKIRLSNLLSANRIRLLYLLILVLPSVRPVSADSLDDVHFKYASRHMWGKQYLDFRPDLEDWSRSGGVQYESSWGGLFQTDNRQSNGGDIIPLSLYPARLNELLPFPEKTPDTFIDNQFNGNTWNQWIRTNASPVGSDRNYFTMFLNQIRVWAVVDSPAIDTIRIPVLQVDADLHGEDYRCISFAEFVIPKGDTVSKPCDLVDRTEIEYEDIVDSKQWHNLWLPLAIVFGNPDESNFGNVVSWSLAQRVYAERGLPNWVNSLDLDEVLPMLNLTWKAIGPGGTVIKGPSGLGESVWPEAATSAITSKPGIYTIICTVQLGNGQKIDITSVANLLPVEVVELSPKTKDGDNNEIAGSEKPSTGKPLTPFVEVEPNTNKIAHRELKVKIGEPLKGKTVTWTMEPLFRRSPGPYPFIFRGEWSDSTTHPNRFEVSTAYGANGFTSLSQESGRTTVADDGFTAIRVNIPPIGFNAARIKIQIEGVASVIDLIDLEVPAVVVIDPGHGGNDSGAVGRTDNTVLEKDLALAYSLGLRQELIDKFKAEDHGLRILMTRDTTDEFLELPDRAQLARNNGADVLVSIHFNSATSTSARGTETFIERTAAEASAGNPGDNKNVDEDLALATALNTTTLNAVTASDAGGLNRGVKREGKAVTRDGSSYNGNTQDYHPVKACLLEVEFLSHETAMESVKLSNATGTAIKSAFSENGSNDIFTNIRDQQ